MTTCDKPHCDKAAAVWYRITGGQLDDRMVYACAGHANGLRNSVASWQIVGRGLMYRGVAEGSGVYGRIVQDREAAVAEAGRLAGEYGEEPR